ncbi:MAG: hypothetical protein AAGC65_17325 [Mucilaginibacter sp.]|uniref:hypothetical protein n=1 Tax=Mucilaginibacter sp. TaxID=1882438 RepID=UPI0031AD0965
MNKNCIFCGKPPQNKNKEHILPKWLIKLTGMEKKQVSVGTDLVTGKEYTFNLLNFTFPACTQCNTDFAAVEAAVKPVMEKLLADDYVVEEELTLLLDWFDKVRLAMHIALHYQNNKNFQLDPKYYINNRVGIKDRFLSVTNTYDGSIGMSWTGVSTYAFLRSPNCFTLRINHMIFVNCSLDFLISEQVGFPYPAWQVENKLTGRSDMPLLSGKGKVANRIFKTPLYAPQTIICQPLFGIAKAAMPEKYDNDYVRSHALDFEKGRGKLFIFKDNECFVLDREEELTCAGDGKRRRYLFNRPTLTLQLEIMRSVRYNLAAYTPEDRVGLLKS